MQQIVVAVTELLQRYGWPHALPLSENGRDVVDVSGVALRIGYRGEIRGFLREQVGDDDVGLMVLADVHRDGTPADQWPAVLRLGDALRLIRSHQALDSVATALADRDDTEAIARYIDAVRADGQASA